MNRREYSSSATTHKKVFHVIRRRPINIYCQQINSPFPRETGSRFVRLRFFFCSSMHCASWALFLSSREREKMNEAFIDHVCACWMMPRTLKIKANRKKKKRISSRWWWISSTHAWLRVQAKQASRVVANACSLISLLEIPFTRISAIVDRDEDLSFSGKISARSLLFDGSIDISPKRRHISNFDRVVDRVGANSNSPSHTSFVFVLGPPSSTFRPRQQNPERQKRLPFDFLPSSIYISGRGRLMNWKWCRAVGVVNLEENRRNSTPELRFCCASPSVLVLCYCSLCLLRFVVFHIFLCLSSVDAQISLGAVRKKSTRNELRISPACRHTAWS